MNEYKIHEWKRVFTCPNCNKVTRSIIDWKQGSPGSTQEKDTKPCEECQGQSE